MKNINETARIFNVARITVYRWVIGKKIKSVKIGKSYKIDEAEIEFIKANGLRGE